MSSLIFYSFSYFSSELTRGRIDTNRRCPPTTTISARQSFPANRDDARTQKEAKKRLTKWPKRKRKCVKTTREEIHKKTPIDLADCWYNCVRTLPTNSAMRRCAIIMAKFKPDGELFFRLTKHHLLPPHLFSIVSLSLGKKKKKHFGLRERSRTLDFV